MVNSLMQVQGSSHQTSEGRNDTSAMYEVILPVHVDRWRDGTFVLKYHRYDMLEIDGKGNETEKRTRQTAFYLA
jgi:hypothetical protein